MTAEESKQLRYRLSTELGSESFEIPGEILFLRCFPTSTGESAAGLASEAQPSTIEDDWSNGNQMTGAADAAAALAHAKGDEAEAERVLLAIAHMRLAKGGREDVPVGIPGDMRRWRVTTLPGVEKAEEGGRIMEVWAQTQVAATGAAAEALRAATAENAEALPLNDVETVD